MSLLDNGWEPCVDVTHTHPGAGDGSMLHPPSGEPGIYAPAQLMTYDYAITEGFATRSREPQ